MKPPKGTERYKWFEVEGIIVGWLSTGINGDEIYEEDVAVVQADDGHTFIRWIGNDWFPVDPPDAEAATVGLRIRFTTNWDEQITYTKIARGIGLE
jgi:hypothetical protein